MAVYAIGDVQGCFEELQALLDKLAFSAKHDRLWFAGDLVNRGPKSLETLRFIKGLGDTALSVLGNHDLHLLAASYGHTRKNDDHTLDAVLNAPDRDELIDWLRHRPLLHHDTDLDFTLVHAGLPPQWDLALAQQCAKEVETILRSDGIADLLTNMYGNNPKQWTDELEGYNRLRFIINCFTRMRFCDPEGRLDLKSKGPPGSQRAGSLPWYEIPDRASKGLNIIFGHWSTLREFGHPGIYPIDSACLWGGELTALRIDMEPQRINQPCPGQQTPKGY